MKNHFTFGLTLCISLLLFTLSGCEMLNAWKKLPFNAMVGVGGTVEFKEEFLKANRTYNVDYMDENGDWFLDLTSPKFRTYIIREKAQTDEIFSICPDIDFEKDMIVMYAYTSIYGSNRYHIIKKITLNNKNLKIDYKISAGKLGAFDAPGPRTRFLVLKMDKLDIDTVEFTWF